MELGNGSTRSPCVVNSLWKSVYSCRKREESVWMNECQNWTYGKLQVFRNSRTLVWSACKDLSANRAFWAENSIGMIYVARLRCLRNSSLRVSSRIINTAFRVWHMCHCKGVQCGKFIGKSNWRRKCVWYKRFHLRYFHEVSFRNTFHVPMIYRVFIPLLSLSYVFLFAVYSRSSPSFRSHQWRIYPALHFVGEAVQNYDI